jgi:hypothetical protein
MDLDTTLRNTTTELILRFTTTVPSKIKLKCKGTGISKLTGKGVRVRVRVRLRVGLE